MLSAIRYGARSVMTFSRPWLFLVLGAVSAVLMVMAYNWFAHELAISQVPRAPLPLTLFGAQLQVINVLGMMFLSVPVAAQFAQEYRYRTLALAFLVAPRRWTLFVSKIAFSAVYIVVSIIVAWIVLAIVGPLIPNPVQPNGGLSSFLTALNPNLPWAGSLGTMWWKILIYVLVYMAFVVAFAIITKSQALGVMIPFFYVLIVESFGAIVDVAEATWFPSVLRPFMFGQAWLTSDPQYPFAGVVFFGYALIALVTAFLLFIRRDSK